MVALWSCNSVNSLEVCWSTEELTIDSLASLLKIFLFPRDFSGRLAVFVPWNLLFFVCSIFGSLLSTAWLPASICFAVGKTFLRFLLFLFGILWLNFLLMAIFSLFSISICWISTLRGLLQKVIVFEKLHLDKTLNSYNKCFFSYVRFRFSELVYISLDKYLLEQYTLI